MNGTDGGGKAVFCMIEGTMLPIPGGKKLERNIGAKLLGGGGGVRAAQIRNDKNGRRNGREFGNGGGSQTQSKPRLGGVAARQTRPPSSASHAQPASQPAWQPLTGSLHTTAASWYVCFGVEVMTQHSCLS